MMVQDPVGRLRVNAQGELGPFRCSVGSEQTLVQLQLGAGEVQSVDVPLLARANTVDVSEVQFHGTDRSAIEALVELAPAGVEWPEPWAELPYSLQARSLPPVASAPLEVSGLQWAWLGMSLLLIFALRRRPIGAFLLGVVGAAGLFFLPVHADPPAPVVTVLEGDATSGRWLEVRGAQDRLALSGPRPGWLRRVPGAAPGQLERLARAGGDWALQFDGARLFFSTEADVGVTPSGAGPGERSLARAWVRLPGESWSFRGSWGRSETLPDAVPDGPSPPGWLAAGLPQGVGVLVAECESGAPGPIWLRFVGFSE